MMSLEYTAIPLDDDGLKEKTRRRYWYQPRNVVVLLLALASMFAIGVVIGRHTSSPPEFAGGCGGEESQRLFFPEIPTRGVKFEFPTKFEETGPAGDELWNSMMPDGSGFLRVAHPRKYGLPPSEPIHNDPEEAEIYSLSAAHQLHCLAVLRDVIIKYEKRDKSRFAGDGHEYHCLDYIRQAILCAGDTTLDYADDRVIDQDGKVTRYGFTGANSTHQCKDWDTIKRFAEKNKAGDRSGIL